MPELPEVETVCRGLISAGVLNKTIASVQVLWEKTVHGMNADQFRNILTGATVTGIQRRAKYVVFTLNHGYTLCVHLKMTGKLIYFKKGKALHAPHDRIRLEFSDGSHVYFNDTRKFGKWHLVKEASAVLGKLGPEPLEMPFDFGAFHQSLKCTTRKLKSVLLDQTIIAGVGNIYADEALWTSKLSPERRANTLSEKDSRQLLAAIQIVLRKGIDHQGTSLGTSKTNYLSVNRKPGNHFEHLKVFRRTGEKCKRCRQIIQRIVIGQRSTHFCPKCQT